MPCPAQVYSLAFHQTMLECTAHAADRGLLLLALWRGFAMLWDAALQASMLGAGGQGSEWMCAGCEAPSQTSSPGLFVR